MKNGYADAFPFPGSEARHQLPLGQHSGAPDAGAGAGDDYHACDKLGGQYVKFSEISYNRPDVEAAKKFYTEAAERLSTGMLCSSRQERTTLRRISVWSVMQE